MSNSELNARIRSNYKVELSSNGHEIIADEPTDIGGGNVGMTPDDLVLSSLAACKLITMRMYAERKGWHFSEARISLAYIEKGDPTVVSKKIEFDGDLQPDQVERLLVISGKCPVAKMLSKSISFRLVD